MGVMNKYNLRGSSTGGEFMIKKLTTCLCCWMVILMIAPESNASAIKQFRWRAVDTDMLSIMLTDELSKGGWSKEKPKKPSYPSYHVNDILWEPKVLGTANEYFRPLSQLPLDRLIDRGIFKIGSINLKQLRKKIGKVNWDVLAYGMISGSGDKRFTAVNYMRDKRVIINRQIFERFADQYNESFLLHEALGAIGINDENYQLSSLIGSLGMEEDMDVLKRKISEIEKSGSLKTDRRWLEVRYQLEEGGTIIGGGGDIETINFKTRCLSLYGEWFTSRYINERHINKLGEEERTNGFSSLLSLKIEKITPGIPALQSLSSPEENQILYRKSDNTLLISNYLLYNHTKDNEKIWFFLDNISDEFLFKF